MEQKNIERSRLWVIPPKGYEDKGLQDGEGIFIDNREHSDAFNEFAREYDFQVPKLASHEVYARYFNQLGFAVVFNSGVTIDEKYFATIFLPEQLTEKQIGFFYDKKNLFKDSYHESVSFFESMIYSSQDLNYKSECHGYRSLKIESIINGENNKNGQELLYKELDRQLAYIKGLGVMSEDCETENIGNSSIKRR